MAEKMTKMEMFASIKELVAGIEGIDKAVVEFLDKEMETLAKRAEKVKENKAKKKSEGDAMKAAVLAVITEELQTVDEIVAQVDGEEVSKPKVVARLTQLVKDGAIEKGTVKVDKSTRAAYKLAVAEEVTEETVEEATEEVAE